MSPNPSRDTTAGRVYNDLRNLAQRQGVSTQELMMNYLLERMLFRISGTSARERFILKGGLLLAQFGARRSTRDADLLGLGVGSEEGEILRWVEHAITLEVDDGVTFDMDLTRTQPIRDEEIYPGLRVTVPARIHRAQIKLQLDISVGDPITPAPRTISYPQQLGGDGFPLLGYPIETVLAEKLTTALHLSDASTRDRDWADVWRLIGIHDLQADVLRHAFARTADHRGIVLRPLSHVIAALPIRRASSYAAWRRRQGPDASAYPEDFSRVVADVVHFADPVLGDASVSRWSAPGRAWI